MTRAISWTRTVGEFVRDDSVLNGHRENDENEGDSVLYFEGGLPVIRYDSLRIRSRKRDAQIYV